MVFKATYYLHFAGTLGWSIAISVQRNIDEVDKIYSPDIKTKGSRWINVNPSMHSNRTPSKCEVKLLI